jgi:uncharacterized membrane protein
MKIKILFIIAILFLPMVFADSANVFLTLKDITNNDDINDIVVRTIIDDEASNYYIAKDEILKINLEDGLHNITILADNINTDGLDYYGKEQITVNNNLIEAFLLFPIGTVRGIVTDQLGNAMPNADIKFECNTDIELSYPEKTDRFGTFNTEVPIGSCTIYALLGKSVVLEELVIEKGNLATIELKIEQKTELKVWLWVLLIVVATAATKLLFIFFKSKKDIEKVIAVKKEKINLGKRAKDIIATLRDREKNVIELLIKNGTMTQAKLHHETGLAKSSLFRVIQSLERKNAIATKRIGKVKRVTLSDWFLEKETQRS